MEMEKLRNAVGSMEIEGLAMQEGMGDRVRNSKVSNAYENLKK